MTSRRGIVLGLMMGEILLGLVTGSQASKADAGSGPYGNVCCAYNAVKHAVVVEAMSYVAGKTNVELWAPTTVLDQELGEASAWVQASPTSYSVELYPTNRRHYPVNQADGDFETITHQIGEWGAYVQGTPHEWHGGPNAALKWPCRWGHNCRAAGKIAITNSLTGELWKTDEGPSDITWTMGKWRIQCNAWPGPSVARALELSRQVLSQIRSYPLPGVAGTLFLSQAADGIPTIGTWQDGKTVIYVWGISFYQAIPIISSMRPLRASELAR